MHCYSYLMVGLKRHGHSDHAAPNAVSENVRDRRDSIRNSEWERVSCVERIGYFRQSLLTRVRASIGRVVSKLPAVKCR